MNTVSDEQLREFLLRRLSPEPAREIEDAIVLVEHVAERLKEQEFDLLDDYAAGRLDSADRADVERHLLSSREGVQALRVARLLRSVRRAPDGRAGPVDASASSVSSRRRVRPWAPLAALASAAALVVVFVIPLRHTAAPPFEAVVTRPAGVTTVAAAAATMPILSLLADVDRGATTAELHWPQGVESVRLQLELPDPGAAGTYIVTIDDSTGRRLFESAATAARSAGRLRYVEAVVPTAALGPGARRVALRSAAAAGAPLVDRQVIGTPDTPALP